MVRKPETRRNVLARTGVRLTCFAAGLQPQTDETNFPFCLAENDPEERYRDEPTVTICDRKRIVYSDL